MRFILFGQLLQFAVELWAVEGITRAQHQHLGLAILLTTPLGIRCCLSTAQREPSLRRLESERVDAQGIRPVAPARMSLGFRV